MRSILLPVGGGVRTELLRLIIDLIADLIVDLIVDSTSGSARIGF